VYSVLPNLEFRRLLRIEGTPACGLQEADWPAPVPPEPDKTIAPWLGKEGTPRTGYDDLSPISELRASVGTGMLSYVIKW
jgi:hypothetical protein